MEPDIEFYRKQFYNEAREIIDRINADILLVENNPEDVDLLNSIFRGVHTIKGSAGGFDLNEITVFVHDLETLLDYLRSGKLKTSSAIVDVILDGLDYVIKMISDAEAGKNMLADEELMQKFKSFLGNDGATQAENNKDKPGKAGVAASLDNDIVPVKKIIEDPLLKDEDREALKEFLGNKNIFKVELLYSKDELINGFDPLRVLVSLESECAYYRAQTDAAVIPEPDAIDIFELYLKPTIFCATYLSGDEIKNISVVPELVSVASIVEESVSPTGTSVEPFESIDENNLKEFILDATDSVDNIEKYILEFEKNYTEESVNAIFRAVHTIKGDTDYIGLKKLASFAHTLESVIGGLKNKKIKKDSSLIDVLLKSLDMLKGIIFNLKSGGGYPKDMEIVTKRLEEAVSARGASGRQPDASGQPGRDSGGGDGQNAPVQGEEAKIFTEQARQFLEQIEHALSAKDFGENEIKNIKRSLNSLKHSSLSLKLMTIVTAVNPVLDVTAKKDAAIDEIKSAYIPLKELLEGFFESPKMFGELLVADGKITEDDLKRALAKQKHVGEILVEDGKITQTDLDDTLKKQNFIDMGVQLKNQAARTGGEEESKTMRVDEKKIDVLGNTVGELVVAKNTYEYLVQMLIKDSSVEHSLIKLFKDNLYSFSRLSGSMQENITAIRMMPIKFVFQKFNRVVRDISRKLNKQIDLIVDGEETEIDKKIGDMLSDPLIHLIRNSCDHGIETPEERRKAMKPEKGTVILRASQEGSNIIIKIIDDGRGINRDKLFEKSVKMGLQYKTKEDPDLLNIIFLPGFSTNEIVNDISGRGVGMDVVKTTMELIGGKISISTDDGIGTEFTMSIPTSVGIEPALLVESSGKTYAIPLEYVIETIKATGADIKNIYDGIGFNHRGEVIPAAYLDELLGNLGHSSYEGTDKMQKDAEVDIVLLHSSRGKFGIIVDEFFKNMEITIKPLPGELSKVQFLGGVTIMGDGKIVLILNPEELVV